MAEEDVCPVCGYVMRLHSRFSGCPGDSQIVQKLTREAGARKVSEWLPEHGGDGSRGFCCHGAPDHEVTCENYPMEAP